MSNLLKIGDTVNWKGGFGNQNAKDAKIESIEVNCEGKDGEFAKSVEWSEVNSRSVIVSLDNEHWAYGTQITQK